MVTSYEGRDLDDYGLVARSFATRTSHILSVPPRVTVRRSVVHTQNQKFPRTAESALSRVNLYLYHKYKFT